jgi:uncharacterized protein YbjQ (UPF0145 family)
MSGGLPIDAVERLQEQASRQGTNRHFFTTDLSVSEFLLSRQIGYEALGFVMGSSVYHIGWQFLPSGNWWYSSQELEILTAAHSEARHLAMNRMLQEASLLDADGVVGVRLTRDETDGGHTEFKAIGTAVRHPEGRKPGDKPFLSSLSGQELWALERGGFAPIGFAFGTCVYFQVPDWRGQTVLSSWQNAELTSLTQGFYTAREIAMERLAEEFRGTDADGVVGVDVESFADARTDAHDNLIGLIVHFTAMGTAVSRMPTRTDFDVKPVLPLVDA